MSTALLRRETFTTSRLAEFCSEKELTLQTGHPVEQWPLVDLKELIDNALDACEEANIAPCIKVSVNSITGDIVIGDNGPGIPPETIKGILDFNVRISSREAYVSPTRGAQGNALKTIVAMAFVLDGEVGETVIDAQGIRHVIRFRINGITREPEIEHVEEPGFVHSGTSVTVRWPVSAGSELGDAQVRFVQMCRDYTWLNPHLSLDLNWTIAEPCPYFGGLVETRHFDASEPEWRKWKPSDPTPVHWYDVERFERLAAAYVSKGRTVRDFVSDFRGMARSSKQKAVLDATGLSRKSLSDLFPNQKPDKEAFSSLFWKLHNETEPVKPEKLGIIGKANLDLMQDIDPETFAYKCVKVDGHLPAVIEVAFAYRPETTSRSLIRGVNWPVGINNPFREFSGLLEELRCGPREPVFLIIHVAYPRVSYMDRGKGAVIFPSQIDNAIQKALTDVTKKWTKQRKAEERDAAARLRREDAMFRSRRRTIKDAAWEYMPTAYMSASTNHTLPANARQIMYAARKFIQEQTERQLDDVYFTQQLLPDYVEETGVDWDVVYDDRGHLSEPHTGLTIGLGTLAVRRYLSDRKFEIVEAGFAKGYVETQGPDGCYGALLYVEKEGFDPLWQAVNLAGRFDIGILSSKGLSVTAARKLIDKICSEHNIPVFVLHDFDKAGFSIVGTLKRNTRRYKFRNDITVIDLGLRLTDIQGLQPESSFDKGQSATKAQNLRLNGATEQEIEFLITPPPGQEDTCTGQRVELNAMTSGQLVAFVERKLTEHGVRKIVPDRDKLAATYRMFERGKLIEQIVEREINKFKGTVINVPDNLEQRVREMLDRDHTLRWTDAVQRIVGEA